MVTFEEKLSQLIDSLLQRTRNRSLSWSVTATSDNFLASFNRFGVSIQRTDTRIILRVLDEDGKVVESWNDSQLFLPDDKNLRELFTLARRSARGIEESLDGLLQELHSI